MDIPDTSSTILLIAIVQAQDAVNASDDLKHIHTAAFQLPSMGGFLGLRNTTLLIQSTSLIWHTVIQVLKQTCKQRIEYTAVLVDATMMANGPFLAPVAVGGATIFSIEVEHFEEV